MNSRAPLGMLLFLLNEAVLFFMLIVAYVYLHAATATPAARSLNLASASLLSLCLVASSFTMWRATVTTARAWFWATLALGAIFLYGQGAEYSRLFRQHITIARDQFGTTFFTLTGIHALHVFIGLILVAVVLSSAGLRPALHSIALYWYFVDAVWLAIFAVVYLGTFL
jgi:heme/copper-type cytochrome/quinol oxidase subunit 3